MGNITTMAVFVWTLNILVFLTQASMIDLNPNSIQFYSTNGTVIEQYSLGGNITMPDQEAISNELNPASSTELEESSSGTGIFFIDAIATVKNWIQNKIEYLSAIVMGPFNLLNSIGLPSNFVGVISLLWYGVSILLLILLILGRAD